VQLSANVDSLFHVNCEAAAVQHVMEMQVSPDNGVGLLIEGTVFGLCSGQLLQAESQWLLVD
jgi:hypothetical protein